ncbi:MAG: phenylalanine--tRNA ligase subunit alpha [Candidatus Kerfeldbacteria bacterium CG08_land_8_20_14_0_20_40_16]|uniref:Phenylalanine--tRNA ligase alpha subunit n=1 Tax=Candidatus Kerfeldbacteria bacterium CG08_land_8_20_14_0_20_40_16 TaxID=2014244 RepID=A0A2H0YYW8_9BACT|nr:MAG: phenylalanine--tRNA ligase subunit alpha [Candidatus Kerfeldbacteria bacterium CG08_land_8_20_14_0_20_40_16]
MKEQLEQLKNKVLEEIKKIQDPKLLGNLEKEYLGRKGKLTKILRKIKDVSAELRPVVGKLANEIKKDVSAAFQEAEIKLKTRYQNSSEFFDPTLPGIVPPSGHLHPITQMLERIWEVFRSMNYDLVLGPEIENDYYNFQALNVPPDHPARDMHDTFYLKGARGVKRERGKYGDLLLRTHTSSISQVRTMEKRKPPIRIMATGKCYRRDDDISHTPMFHQFDGIAIDHNITFADLKGTLHYAMRELLEEEVKVRFRISYFPFVEPGAEFDVTCTICGGRGCPTCKGTGWLEMGGCGIIHPNVMKAAKYDSKKWKGFAFGFGVERPAMVKHRISDIRALFENDLRFLNQF